MLNKIKILLFALLMVMIFAVVGNVSVQAAGVSFNEKVYSESDGISDDAEMKEVLTIDEQTKAYIYIAHSDDMIGVRSVSAKKIYGYFSLKVGKETVLKIKLTVQYSYGHSDGIVRITSSKYEVIKLAKGYTVGEFVKKSQNGSPAWVTLAFTYTYEGGSERGNINLHMKNNGDYY